ncbi:MAG: heavy-metal-associated domain-containing protein [Fimbriimonadaceae bacterium]
MKTLKYRSEGIRCERCAEKVVACLTPLAGVAKVVVDVPTQTIVVEADETASDTAVRQALDEAGFEVAD